jgi:hypothetical protein
MQTISLRLPDDLFAQLRGEAKARRTTQSQLVRESLDQMFRKRARGRAVSCNDLSRDLVGSIKGLPKDLSFNARHMEDYGK